MRNTQYPDSLKGLLLSAWQQKGDPQNVTAIWPLKALNFRHLKIGCSD